MKKKKSLSEPDVIRDLLENVNSRYKSNFYIDIEVPPHRQYEIGTKVVIGNLINCEVVGRTPDYKSLVIRHDRNVKEDIIPGNYSIWSWWEVFVLNSTTTNLSKESIVHNSFRVMDVSGLIHTVFKRGVVDSPVYQRGYVWNQNHQEHLIESLLQQRDIGKFLFLQDATFSDYTLEVIDGKQRLKAITNFVLDLYQYKGLYYSQLSKHDKRLFESNQIHVSILNRHQYTQTDIYEIFLDLNIGGIPQSEDHINYVRDLLKNERQATK